VFTTDKRIVAFEILIVALCLYIAIDAPAYAHDCVGRMQKAKSVADLLAQSTIEDCMRTGYIQALVTAIAAAMAGGAIAVAVARALTQPPPDWLDDWKLKDPYAFCKLGERIKQLPGFQAANTPEERASYVFDRMREVAKLHNLRAASGGDVHQGSLDEWRIGYYRGQRGPLLRAVGVSALAGAAIGGAASRSLIGAGVGFLGGGILGAIAAYRNQPKPGDDREGCPPLKFGGLGNCGDWAIAMQAALRCAGVDSKIVAADDSPDTAFSEGHEGTFTTVIVPDPNDAALLQHPEKWKYFDMYMHLSETEKGVTWAGIGSEQWMGNFGDNKKDFIKELGGSHAVKAWRCACGTINGWSAVTCRTCKAGSPLPPAR
jgi:hypothetical protein